MLDRNTCSFDLQLFIRSLGTCTKLIGKLVVWLKMINGQVKIKKGQNYLWYSYFHDNRKKTVVNDRNYFCKLNDRFKNTLYSLISFILINVLFIIFLISLGYVRKSNWLLNYLLVYTCCVFSLFENSYLFKRSHL